jgi:hypothetical protein
MVRVFVQAQALDDHFVVMRNSRQPRGQSKLFSYEYRLEVYILSMPVRVPWYSNYIRKVYDGID